MNNLFCLGDLHLGDGSKADDFCTPNVGSDLDPLTSDRACEYLVKYHDPDNYKMVVTGDVFERWQTSMKAIQVTYKSLLAHLDAIDALLIKGNHDEDADEYYSMAVSSTQILQHLFVQIEHGHGTDPRMTSPFSKFVNKLLYWFENLLHPNIERILLQGSDEQLIKDTDAYALKKLKAASLEPVEGEMIIPIDQSIHVVVFGHTHVPGIWKALDEHGAMKGLYVNTGACEFAQMMHTIIEDDYIEIAKGDEVLTSLRIKYI